MMQIDPANSADNSKPVDLSTLLTPKGLSDAFLEIVKSNASILKGLSEIDTEAMKVAKTFGVGRDQVQSIKKAYSEARDAVIDVGGTASDVWKNQQSATAAIGKNIILSKEAQVELTASVRASGQESKVILSSFADIGVKTDQVGENMLTILNKAREFGAASDQVSKMALENMSKMNQYNFAGGVDGLSKMAAQAVSLRVDMKETMAVAEKAFNPEGAMKMAAELQRLGVQQSSLLDPLQLMNMAENDPAELQNQIAEMSKQFVHMNEKGQFEILPGAKRQMREIEKSLGMATGTLAKMALSGAEVDEKLSKVKFPEFATEEQKKTLANIAQMKDGKVMIDVNGEQKDLSDAIKGKSKEEIDTFIKQMAPKSIEELSRSQLTVLEDINKGIQKMKGQAATQLTGDKEGNDFLNNMAKAQSKFVEDFSEKQKDVVKDIVSGAKQTSKDMADNLNSLNEGRITLSELGQSLLSAMATLSKISIKSLSDAVTPSTGGTNDWANKLNVGITDFTKAVDKFVDDIIEGQDIIISPGNGVFKTYKEDTIIAATGMEPMLKSVSENKPIGENIVQPNENKIQNIDTTTMNKVIEAVVQNNANNKVIEIKNETPKILPTFNEQLITEKKESKQTIDLNENIEITFKNLPPQINEETIKEIFRSPKYAQMIKDSIEKINTNTNLTK
jgi:hypothetical protein